VFLCFAQEQIARRETGFNLFASRIRLRQSRLALGLLQNVTGITERKSHVHKSFAADRVRTQPTRQKKLS